MFKGEVPFLSSSLLNIVIIVIVVSIKNHILQTVGCHFERKSKCLYMLPCLSVRVVGRSGRARTAVCLSVGAGCSDTLGFRMKGGNLVVSFLFGTERAKRRAGYPRLED